MSEEFAIDIQNLVKVYKNSIHTALSGISLQIKKDDLFGLLGPNGAGKTTLISIITGLVRPTEGSVKLFGRDAATEFDAVKKLIGLVPQSIALYPSLTAYENLNFFGSMAGIPKNELREKVRHWLSEMGLEKSADRSIDTYSGGMKRRINLIAGLLHDPKLLILDEPTVGVDVQSRILIQEQLTELNKKGTTIIYTSHYLEEAENMCTSIAIIDQGKLICKGTPHQLKCQYNNSPNLEEMFILATGKSLRD